MIHDGSILAKVRTVFFELQRHRVRIGAIVLTSVLLVIGASFLVSPRYRASVTILPDVEKDKLSRLAGSLDVSFIAGMGVGEGQVSKLYPMIVKSTRILENVIQTRYVSAASSDSVNLIKFWSINTGDSARNIDIALRTIRSRLDANWDVRLEAVSISVVMEEAQLAAAVANKVTTELDRYTRLSRRTNASAQRDFIERRIKDVEVELANAEESLKRFQEKNRRIGDSPELILEQERLKRNVQIKSAVYLELKKQYEIARIEEIKNIPVINVLDSARVPIAREWPRRTEMAITTTILMSLLSIFGVAVWTLYGSSLRETLRSLRRS